MDPNNNVPNLDEQVASINSGCGSMFCVACIVIMIVGSVIPSVPTVVCGAIGATIGLIIVFKSRKTGNPVHETPDPVNRTSRNPAQNTTSNQHTIQVNPAYNGIDQAYFNTVLNYGEKLYAFLQKIKQNSELKEEFYRTNSHLNIPSEHLMSTLMIADILKIYHQLEYKIGIDKKESFAMIYLSARMNNIDGLTFNKLPIFYDRIVKTISDFLPTVEQINASNAHSDSFFILGTLIYNVDKETGKQYYSLLYRYASLIAKADGTITTKESDFLKSIMASHEVENRETESTTSVSVDTLKKNDGISQLQQLIGLDLVKNDVSTLVNFIKIQNMRATKGMKAPSLSYHCVFTGNPGTGKTTVARILATIYKELGLLKRGHLVETDRSGLVAEYVGQTAVKTNKIVDSALDGVLFIDEAYSLVSGSANDYGKEAIATLLKRMEDERGRLVVILAGYTEEMKTFIESNPGLQSRFNRYIKFEDYSGDELMKIFLYNLEKYEYFITDGAINKMKQLIDAAVMNKDRNFGNARWVRNIFEKTLELQANRLASDGFISNESLTTITECDIPFSKIPDQR